MVRETEPEPGRATPQPRFTRTRPNHSAINDILPHLGRGIAVGRLYGLDGRPLTPLVGPGEGGGGDGLVESLRSKRFVNHVETNATGYMRRHGIREAVLYTNMGPCTGEDGCQRNLRSTLPPGHRLTIYQVGLNGSVKVWFFPGHGGGLSDEHRG